MTGGSTRTSGPSIEVAARGLALARRDTRGSGDASSDLDARRNRGCRRSLHRHPRLAAADDDQPPGLGETPDTRRLEPLPPHLDRRRNLPGVIEGLDLPMSGAMEASRTGETAGSNGLSEMAGPGGDHLRGPRNGESASVTCMFTNSRSPAHDWNPATPGPIDDSLPHIEALDESTPPTIRPEGCIARLVHVFPATGSPISGVDDDRSDRDRRGPRGHRRPEPPANRKGCRSASSAR